MRKCIVGGAQLGAIQKTDSRESVVARMLELMDQAHAASCDLLVFPELALTTFFPRWYSEDPAEIERWFESEMPNQTTMPLFERARMYQMAITFGYAESTPDGRHFNASLMTDRNGDIIAKYRKVHLPGHDAYDPERAFQHLEKYYFEPGDLGFHVFSNLGGIMGMAICNDRRWPETYRVLGLQGVELVTIGYNTPAFNAQRRDEADDKRLFHSLLSMQAGAYQNSTYVVGVAKAGVEDGHELIGGSVIIDPNGFVLAEAKTQNDELIVAACDFDESSFGKETIFDFKRHRRTEHYRLIVEQTGVEIPAEVEKDLAKCNIG
ncbi:N-carbamoyl-D-amino-acid hydrolase [Brenneria goodwinii]|uniref:N-carbamoyl-D-amino-acid hydrolase n=1 Tax=Brenneria goodwinii TaxID=1109412 RepID=A0AAE8JM23_9GAMM|nr:N-carbamoyl-D-amino-acid hydrolase [Brenneria goodwinii]ATA23727.1 N-carbamoyl-D-amino-acid hydrolase [Brenneria goodwinii]MCG8154623.1 N-carbamoyl-D-amino-acid hydrolase [Brenneria goodwinii]MCG8160041.1 N-carbamoyl-D-amino-acid hydrolase [Brenneria goodwinii]MCG8163861.1 N-carbamoyl-D-amino-acid hydrolase [Brenneria goodwinii]MCG8168470.1 N-carbamoyl-D-amino-acid hydrolase [Brenneria goodwinii]